MANKRHVSPDQLVNRRGGRGRGLTVVVPERRRAPLVPAGCGTHARDVWRRFWRHPVSAAVEADADYEQVRWWILAVDERERLRELLQGMPLTKGANGQLMLNPLARRVAQLSKDIDRFCDKFGLTPAARFQLQITYAEAGRANLRLVREEEKASRRARTVTTRDVLDLDAEEIAD